jgi:hypothetical protein
VKGSFILLLAIIAMAVVNITIMINFLPLWTWLWIVAPTLLNAALLGLLDRKPFHPSKEAIAALLKYYRIVAEKLEPDSSSKEWEQVKKPTKEHKEAQPFFAASTALPRGMGVALATILHAHNAGPCFRCGKRPPGVLTDSPLCKCRLDTHPWGRQFRLGIDGELVPS